MRRILALLALLLPGIAFAQQPGPGAVQPQVLLSMPETVTQPWTFSGAGTGLAVTNNATVGGTLGVTGTLSAPTLATGSTTARTLAARAADVFNVKDYGAVGDGLTDDSTAINAALTADLTTGGVVYFPAGVYLHNSCITATIPAGVSVTLQGQGSDATIIKSASGVDGMCLTLATMASSFHIRDMTVEAAGTATGTKGISATLTATTNPAAAALNDITNVTVRGANAYANSQFFDTGVYINGVSNINYVGLVVEGNASKTAAACVRIVGTSSIISVVHNFVGATMNYCNTGLWADIYTQGITVSQSNFTGDQYGVYEPAGTGTTQLTVTNSQFNCTLYGVYNHGGVRVTVANNLFILMTVGAQGVDTLGSSGFIETGNTFQGNNSSGTFGDHFEGNVTGVVSGNYYNSVPPHWLSTPNTAYPIFFYYNVYSSGGFSLVSGSTAIYDMPQIFASLLACGSTLTGRTATVSDSNTATPGATVAGGGSNPVNAFCNGTNWVVM